MSPPAISATCEQAWPPEHIGGRQGENNWAPSLRGISTTRHTVHQTQPVVSSGAKGEPRSISMPSHVREQFLSSPFFDKRTHQLQLKAQTQMSKRVRDGTQQHAHNIAPRTDSRGCSSVSQPAIGRMTYDPAVSNQETKVGRGARGGDLLPSIQGSPGHGIKTHDQQE